MSDKLRTPANPEPQKSPKVLDDKVLAYARNKAEANKQKHNAEWSKSWYTGAASMAVLVLAVLLYPALEQSVEQEPAYDIVLKPEPAAKKAKPKAISMKAESEDAFQEEDSENMESVTVTASLAPQEEITVKAEKRMPRSRESFSGKELEEIVVSDENQMDEASVSPLLDEELLTELKALKEVYKNDKNKAHKRYSALKLKNPLLPKDITDAFDLLGEE